MRMLGDIGFQAGADSIDAMDSCADWQVCEFFAVVGDHTGGLERML